MDNFIHHIFIIVSVNHILKSKIKTTQGFASARSLSLEQHFYKK